MEMYQIYEFMDVGFSDHLSIRSSEWQATGKPLTLDEATKRMHELKKYNPSMHFKIVRVDV